MPVSFNVLVVQPSTLLPRHDRGSFVHPVPLYTEPTCHRNPLPRSAQSRSNRLLRRLSSTTKPRAMTPASTSGRRSAERPEHTQPRATHRTTESQVAVHVDDADKHASMNSHQSTGHRQPNRHGAFQHQGHRDGRLQNPVAMMLKASST